LSVRRQGIVRDSLAPRKRTSVASKTVASYYETAQPDHANRRGGQARAPERPADGEIGKSRRVDLYYFFIIAFAG